MGDRKRVCGRGGPGGPSEEWDAWYAVSMEKHHLPSLFRGVRMGDTRAQTVDRSRSTYSGCPTTKKWYAYYDAMKGDKEAIVAQLQVCSALTRKVEKLEGLHDKVGQMSVAVESVDRLSDEVGLKTATYAAICEKLNELDDLLDDHQKDWAKAVDVAKQERADAEYELKLVCFPN